MNTRSRKAIPAAIIDSGLFPEVGIDQGKQIHDSQAGKHCKSLLLGKKEAVTVFRCGDDVSADVTMTIPMVRITTRRQEKTGPG